MDRIDHYPIRDSNSDNANLGRVAGEIAALREQQERLYYRDEALNETKQAPTKKGKREPTHSVEESDIGLYDATRIIVHQTPSVQSNDFADGCMMGIFAVAAAIALFFMFVSI